MSRIKDLLEGWEKGEGRYANLGERERRSAENFQMALPNMARADFSMWKEVDQQKVTHFTQQGH